MCEHCKQQQEVKSDELSEDEGVKAIIYLQRMVSIEGTEEKARAGWRGMNEHEKRETINIYRMFNEEKPS